MSAVKITDLITPAYYPAWVSMRRFLMDEYWFPGGRGSGKSTVAALHVVTTILSDRDANAVCYRKRRSEIESTVYAECIKAINRLGMSEYFRTTTSPYEITFIPTGQKIFFRGLDDAGKSKGLTPTRGYIQVAWFDELDQFSSMREIDTVLQSVGRGGARFHALFTFNPPESKANWVNVEAARQTPHRVVIRTSYKDWRADWLGPYFFRKMDRIRAVSEMRYRHEYLGEVTGTGHEIFTRVIDRRFTADDIAEMRSKRWGMDFGQADPTVLLGTNYISQYVDGEDVGGVLQIFDEYYECDARNRNIYEAIRQRGLLDTLIVGDPGGGGKSIIAEVRDMGVRYIQQAYKPGGSVEKGIRFFRNCSRIEIDADRCPNAYREYTAYQYELARDGTNRNEFPDRDNHTIDAGRYSRQDEIFAGGMSRLLI